MAPSITYHKGLLNGPGQNNCFLNSAVQVLWHLDIFRRSFRELSGHACMADSCIFCALKDLFGQLQFSHERALPPDALRKALAQSFTDQHRFQLGFMDDAAECFENILLRIHFHIAYNEAEDMCNAKHCIPHQKFAMTLVEQSVCGACHATSEPLPFTQMVHYVSASALISQAKQMVGTSHPDLFGQLLKKAGGMGDIRDCPSSCGAKIQIRRTLINRPEIVSVGIVWDSDRPSLEHIISLLDTLSIHLRLSDVFHGSFDSHHGDNTLHQLVGVVTYYGKHYSTFFFHTKLRVWVYFDDANVREVGPHWEHVVEKCKRGRYQPLLLLFATPNGTPVDASNAPKVISLVDKPNVNLRNGHDVMVKTPTPRCSLSPVGSTAMGGRRSLSSSPEKSILGNELNQRRAITPNPEPSVEKKSLLPNNDYQNLVQYQEAIFNRSNVCEENDLKKSLLDKQKFPMRTDLVRRDSGNWSGDRNSASSSSSTSLENPYQYIIGKMHMRNYGGVPKSPNKSGDLSSGSGNSSGGPADPGYDSFSLSSTDSLPIQQNLKHNFQLAQIPEGHQTPTINPYLIDENTRVADDCERLCAEVDQLLDRSERAEDLITALSLCNAAVNKARAAMDAPYSNPQTASFATMKHNACVLRARSLHRKLEEPLHNNLKYGENRHNREGSNSSTRGSANSHSRQNSKDKGNHSRQNSQEYLDSSGNIRTSPVKVTSPDLKANREKLSPSKNIEIYATLPKNKKGLLMRSSPKTKSFIEDEEYLMKDRPGRSLLSNRSKVTSKKEVEKRARSEDRNSKNVKDIAPVVIKDKEKEQKDSKKQSKQEDKQNKKQHKIRRKLLMGGLIRRKNRSMPDLREDENCSKEVPKQSIKEVSKDDSMVDSKTAIQSTLNGYLSEGNLEYTGNPNLERSKLMRKSFYGSKLLQFNKVPPPPPLRTTSQLSKNDLSANNAKKTDSVGCTNQRSWNQEPVSLPYMSNNFETDKNKTDAIMYSNGGFLLSQSSMNTVVTKALIHQEPSFQSLQPSVDEPDFVSKTEDSNFQLPPYPSPIHSNVHSRQASEEFPPPPTTLPTPPDMDASFMARLQEKCEKLGLNEAVNRELERTSAINGENWLRELQAKQAERRRVVDSEVSSHTGNMGTDEVDYVSKSSYKEIHSQPSIFKAESQSSLKSSIINDNGEDLVEGKRRSGKKKNVTFCEQVVLVATADDVEVDNYIPNPILERVLRTVCHKDSNIENKEHLVHSVVPLKRTDSWKLSQGLALKTYKDGEDMVDGPVMNTKDIKSSNRGQYNTEAIARQMSQQAAMEGCDEVDGPCVAANQMQHNVASYIGPNSYGPNYIPASSLCPPNRIEHRCEYSESIPSNEQSVYNGYGEAYGDQNTNINSNGTGRKMNDNYLENSRYSPVCNRDAGQLQNGHHSAYQPYQNASPSYQSQNSPSYQPMSLQYYPSQSRSSPQIQYRDQNQAKTHPSANTSAPQPSLMRQNSNAGVYNKQLPPQDPRRMPVANLPPNSMTGMNPRPGDNQRSQYYNANAYGQRSNGGPAYPANGGNNSYGYNSDVRNNINGHVNSANNANSTSSPCNVANSAPYYPTSSQQSNDANQQNQNGSLHHSANGQTNGSHSNTNQIANHNNSYTPASSYPIPNQNQFSSQYANSSHQNGYAANGVNQQNMQNNNQYNIYSQNSSNSSNSDSLPRSGASSSPYQSVPQNSAAYEAHSRNNYNNNSVYQHVAYSSMNNNSNHQTVNKFGGSHARGNLPPVYQHPPPPTNNGKSQVYQRVPTPNQQFRQEHNQSPAKYPAYQHPPMPKQPEAKKLNAVVPCNLCRKKQISPPSVYCTDCDFYISRFKQKS